MTNAGNFNTAPFELEIEKFYNGEYWVNRYYIQAADLQGAEAAGTTIVSYERAVHHSVVTFTKLNVRTTIQQDYSFITTPLNLQGQSGLTGELLALFNVVRVDFGAASGRPSRKYYRGCLTEAVVTFTDIAAAHINGFNTALAQPLANMVSYVDRQGTALVTGNTYPKVAMRQLRRGSKKKVTP